jgi:hypothetical protein
VEERGGGQKKSAGREPKVVGRAGAYRLTHTHTSLACVEELDGYIGRFTGSTDGVANGYRDDLEILSGTGAFDAPAPHST